MSRTTAETEKIAAVRALMTRPKVETLRLSSGFYTLTELVGEDRRVMVDALLPQGRDGVRPDYYHAHDIATWAVYEQPEQVLGMDREAGRLIGYVMRFNRSGGRFWAEYISDVQGEMCHAEHAPTLTRAVAAIVRQRANENHTVHLQYVETCRRWAETLDSY